MKLNEVCEVYSGYALKEFHDTNEGYPVIKIGNICLDGTLDLEKCQFTSDTVNEKYYSKKGDIYVALSGATTGKIGIHNINEKYIVNQRVGIVRKLDDNIPDQFIKYFLMNKTEKILRDASGCAQPNISPKQIGQYELPKVNYYQMIFISDVLQKVSNIIKQKKKEVLLLDDLIKSRFIELFGACNCRISTFGKEFSFISRGKSPSYVELSDLAVINQACIYWNSLNFDKVKYNDVSYSGDRILQFGDVLVNSTGTGTLGRANIFMRRSADKRYMVDSHVTIIRGSVSCHPVYIKCYLEQAKIQDAIYRNCVSGSTNQIELSKEKFKELELPVPPMALQKQFAAFVEQTDKSKFILYEKEYIFTIQV